MEAAAKLRSGASVSSDQLIEICVKRLGSFKSPDKVYVLDDLPKGPSGKIQRIKLPELTA